jgi:hypothetical protein
MVGDWRIARVELMVPGIGERILNPCKRRNVFGSQGGTAVRRLDPFGPSTVVIVSSAPVDRSLPKPGGSHDGSSPSAIAQNLSGRRISTSSR